MPGLVASAQRPWAGEAISPSSMYRTAGGGELRGIVVDLQWVADTLLPEVAHGIAPARQASIGVLQAEHPSLRGMLPGWRVALVPLPPLGPPWLRPEFLTFAATTLVVLAVLVIGVLVLMRDVARETTLNRMRADLVGGVSHELKTPLSVIRMYAETIDEALDAPVADRRRFASAIVQETERLRRLIDGVIDYSRIEQGERVYSLEVGSIGPVVRRIVDRYREYLATHGFSLESHIPQTVPPVRFDEVAVDQAVMNLLDNAFKYSGDSTTIAIRVMARTDAVAIEVQDHGIGIASADRARVFERFHRGRHRDRGGYGLGLYLVQHVMTAHGGTVQLVSEEGRGSTFALVFPLAESPERLAVPADSTQGNRVSVVREGQERLHAEGSAGRG